MPLRRGRGGSRLAWDCQPGLGRPVHDAACDRETLAALVPAIKALLLGQRAVIYLRDVRGLAPNGVCEIFGISDGAE